MDDFRGHSDRKVKERTLQLKGTFKWEIIAGGITPKAQPLDVMIKKIWKGFFHDIFEEWSLNAPMNPKTGNPVAPSPQLLAQWVVVAWGKNPMCTCKKGMGSVWISITRRADIGDKS